MAKYEITTESGKYLIETESGPAKETTKPSKKALLGDPLLAQFEKTRGAAEFLGEAKIGAFEGATGGLVRQGLSKLTGGNVQLPRGEGVAGVTGQLVGAAMGAPAAGGRAALGAVRGATKAVPGLQALFSSQRFLPKAAQFAVEGAAAGALLPQEGDFSVKGRAEAAKTGAVAGAVLGPVASKLGKFIGKGKKLEKLEAENVTLAQEMRDARMAGKSTALESTLRSYGQEIDASLAAAENRAKEAISTMSLGEAKQFRQNWPVFEKQAKKALDVQFNKALESAGDIKESVVTKIMDDWTDDLVKAENGYNIDSPTIQQLMGVFSKYVGRGPIKARELSNLKADVQDIIKQTRALDQTNASRAAFDLATRITDAVVDNVPGIGPVRDQYRALSVASKFAGDLGVGKSTIKSPTTNLIAGIAKGKTTGEEIERFRQLRLAMRAGGAEAVKQKTLLQEIASPEKIERAARQFDDELTALAKEKLAIEDAIKSASKAASDKQRVRLGQIQTKMAQNREVIKRLQKVSALGKFGKELPDIVFKGGTGYLLFQVLNKLKPE